MSTTPAVDGPGVEPVSPSLKAQLESALERIPVTGAHRQIVFMILLGVFFDALEQNAVGLVGPILREQWELDGQSLGLLNTITFSATAVGRLLTGLLSDKYGRRTMLTINLLVFSVGGAICALAPTYAVLATGRGLVGLGLGGEIAIAVIMISEFFSTKARGTAVGIVNVTAAGLGNMLAPAFGILVFAIFTGPDRWRYIFAALVLPALLVFWFRRYVPETPRYLVSRGKVAEANVVLNRLASGKLKGGGAGTEHYLHVSGGAVLESENTGSLREVFAGQFRRRTAALGVAAAMSYGAQISVLTLIPTILVAQGHSITKSLVFTLIMQSGSLVGALTASLIARRLPRKRVMTVGAGLAFTFALGFGFLSGNLALALLFGALFNFSIILLNTSIWIFAPELYPTRVRGLGTATILAIGSLSGGLFPILAGGIFDAAGIPGMFSLLAGLFVVFAIATQFTPETFGMPLDDG